MALRLSRRKISEYYASELLAGNKHVATQLAAYLIETKRLREVELITRDIEAALARQGVVIADIASARELSDPTRQAITKYLTKTTGAASVQLKESVQSELIGGIHMSVPGAEMDATLKRKIMKLRAAKV